MSLTVTDLIPHRPPFLFLDEIVEHDAKSLSARRTWRAGEDFYQGHYPDAPITPGVLMCESVFQAGAAFMALQARAAGQVAGEGVPLLAKITDVRFRNPVFPGDTTIISVAKIDEMGGFTMMTGNVKKADGTRVLTVNFAVAWKTPESK
jgi:3-hydroxyacyl-[acyl-carrier-protein] dehydratase